MPGEGKAEIRSLSAYIRKMALDGYCLNLDLPQLRRMSYLLQNCSNNLNQLAKAANEWSAKSTPPTWRTCGSGWTS